MIAPNDNTVIFVIDGSEARTPQMFLEQVYARLAFPDPQYMNWDAYIDWMRDLSWIKERRVCLLVTDWELFLGSPQRRLSFMEDYTEDICPFWEKEMNDAARGDPLVKELEILYTPMSYSDVMGKYHPLSQRSAYYYALGIAKAQYSATVVTWLETDLAWIFTVGYDKPPAYKNSPKIQISKLNGKREKLSYTLKEMLALSREACNSVNS